ncbi:nitrate- and nitrite sensing domain-containing protein, partial [Desulfurobacterium sp.]|uniref:nitrate- and nitrite sensing domain-containing protein n=1 Tax=Desulfurobacterium sp. TaxID=2004706 RepID=UPI002629F1E3
MELTRESLYRVRNIFLLMVMAIFAISITYSFMGYKKLKADLDSAKTLKSTTKLIDILSDVVQELQKERGMSAGYIGSGGMKFKDLLPKQRKKTDEAIQRASKFLQEFDTDKLPYLSNEKINEAFGVYLTQLNVIRKKVDNLQIPLKEELAFYTNAINDLLDAIFTLSKIAPSPETERDIVAYGT